MAIGKLLAQGGWAMWPIYLCSLLGLAVCFQSLVRFQAIRARKLPWLREVLVLLDRGELDKALIKCADYRHPVAHVIACSAQLLNLRPERVESEARRVASLELQRFEAPLPLLSFIAQVAPLLGLLGTVIGMVQMFLGLQTSGMANVNASQLSSGIWQALLTTAGGLMVAAPTLAAHLYFSTRVERFRHQLEDAIEQFLSISPLSPQQKTPGDNQPHKVSAQSIVFVEKLVEKEARR
jgi:biopolymer transport protein ExbB